MQLNFKGLILLFNLSVIELSDIITNLTLKGLHLTLQFQLECLQLVPRHSRRDQLCVFELVLNLCLHLGHELQFLGIKLAEKLSSECLCLCLEDFLVLLSRALVLVLLLSFEELHLVINLDLESTLLFCDAVIHL